MVDRQTGSAHIAQGDDFISYNALGVDELFDYYNYWNYLRTPDGSLIAGQLLADGDSNNTHPYYYLQTPTGSIAGLTDTNGNLVDSYTYSPYGTQTTTTQQIPQSWGYDGGLQLQNTNLIQYGARYYQPNTATWTQTDPSGQSTGYTYADDDPINLWDPDGLNTCKTIASVLPVGGACKWTVDQVSAGGKAIASGATAAYHYVAKNGRGLALIGAGALVTGAGVAGAAACAYFTDGLESFDCYKLGAYGVGTGGLIIGLGAQKLAYGPNGSN